MLWEDFIVVWEDFIVVWEDSIVVWEDSIVSCVHFPAGAFFWRKKRFLENCEIKIIEKTLKTL